MSEKYKRYEDATLARIFKNHLRGIVPEDELEGMKFYKRPDIPTITFKRGMVKHSMTDFRLLHPLAKEAFVVCVNEMLGGEISECCIRFAETVNEDTINIVADILMGFKFTADKGGKNGYMTSICAVVGFRADVNEDGSTEVTFHLDRHFAKWASVYGSEHGHEKIALVDLCLYIADKFHNEM